eukprot:jgi/Astpho2/6719/Aster-x0739
MGLTRPLQGPAGSNDANLIQRLEDELLLHTAALGGAGGSDLQLYSVESDMRFHPEISRRAHQRAPRSLEELSEGDRLRRHCYLEQLRLEKLLEEEKLLTFKPQINPYPDVQPRLSLRNPDAYLQQVRSKEAARMALQLEMRRQREEEELKDCTFSPKTGQMPDYLKRMANGHAKRTSAGQLANVRYATAAVQQQRDWVS